MYTSQKTKCKLGLRYALVSVTASKGNISSILLWPGVSDCLSGQIVVDEGSGCCLCVAARSDSLNKAEGCLHHHTQMQAIFQDLSALQL